MTKAKIVKPGDSVIPTVTEVEMPADFLVGELEGNKLVDKKIKEMVRGFILEDKDIDREIAKVVEKVERERFKIFLAKMGAAIWSVLMIILGSIITLLVKHFS